MSGTLMLCLLPVIIVLYCHFMLARSYTHLIMIPPTLIILLVSLLETLNLHFIFYHG